jgi:hypothetical protein
MTPKQCQRKEKEEHEQEHDDVKGHNEPRCWK